MHPMIEAFRETAAHRLDPPFWQYVQRGCGMGISVAEAESSWAAYRLRPRTLREGSTVDLGLDLFGTWSNPVGVAPTAFHKLTHAEGEIATAGAAGAVGSPFVLSSRSTCRIEDVGAAVRGPWWFQVYMTLTREVTEGMVRRAVATGATALVLTVDTPYVGHRNIPDSGRPMEMTDELALVNMGDHLTPQQARAPWSHIDQDPAIGVETLGLALELGDHIGVEQFAQLDRAQQLAQQRRVDRECGRSALGERGVALVHECAHVAEQQVAGIGRRLPGLGLDQADAAIRDRRRECAQ